MGKTLKQKTISVVFNFSAIMILKDLINMSKFRGKLWLKAILLCIIYDITHHFKDCLKQYILNEYWEL